MKKTFAILSVAALLLNASCTKPAQETANCIDESKINPDLVCTMQYNPVCGCDGQTYSNPCVAERSGVTSYTKGECATKQ